MGRDWKEKVDSMGSQAKQLSSRQGQTWIFHFFLASFHGAEERNAKSWGHALLHWFRMLNKWLPGWCGVDGQVKYAQHLHYSLQKQLVMFVFQQTVMEAGSPPASAGCSPILAESTPFTLFCSLFASKNRVPPHVQYNKEDSETQITGGWTVFCKGIVSLLWSSPTPSATDHSLDFIYLFFLLFTEWFTEQLY